MSPTAVQVEDTRTSKSGFTASLVLDPNQPVPFEAPGIAFSSPTGSRYIPFLAPSNDFFETLLGARLLSNTHNLCIITKTRYCLGSGVEIHGKGDKAFTDWSRRVNNRRQSLNAVIQKILESHFTYGNAFIQPVRTIVGGKKYFHVNVVPVLDCRLKAYDERKQDYSDGVIVSRTFRRNGCFNVESSYETPIYDTNALNKVWGNTAPGVWRTMIHLRNEIAGYDDYGMPSCIASLPDQLLEYKSARFNMDAFDNDLSLGGVITMEGSIDEAEANRIAKRMIKTHSGDGRRSRWMAIASEEGIEKIKIQPFEKQVDGSYIDLDKRMEAKIIAANEWDSILAGINADGGLGKGSGWVRTLFNIKNVTVIQPVQQMIINEVIRPVLQMADEWLGTDWSSLDIQMQTPLPKLFSGDIDTNSVMTVDEGREQLGLDAAPAGRGEQFISEVASKKQGGTQNVSA